MDTSRRPRSEPGTHPEPEAGPFAQVCGRQTALLRHAPARAALSRALVRRPTMRRAEILAKAEGANPPMDVG